MPNLTAVVPPLSKIELERTHAHELITKRMRYTQEQRGHALSVFVRGGRN